MAGKDKCAANLTGDGFDPKKANKIVEQVDKMLKGDLKDKVITLTEARRVAMKRQRYFNALNNKVKRKEILHRFTTARKFEETNNPVDLLSGIDATVNAYNDEKHLVSRQVLGSFERELEQLNPGAWDMFTDKKNDLNLYREIQAQRKFSKDQRPTTSVTGDETLFGIAKILVSKQDQLLGHETQAGSLKGFLENWVHKQRWDQNAIAINFKNADEFFEVMSPKVKINGELVDDKKTWAKLFHRFRSGNHVKLETQMTQGIDQVGAHFSQADVGSLAELSGLSRKLEFVSPEAYMEVADKVFSGDSLADRLLADLQDQAHTVVALKTWGSNPEQQYADALQELIDKTKGDENFLEFSNFVVEKGGKLPFLRAVKNKHILDGKFYKEIVPKGLLDKDNAIDHVLGAQVSSLFRGGEALTGLQQSVFVAITDATFTAKRLLELDGGEGFIGTHLLQEYGKTLRDLAPTAPVNFGRFAKWAGTKANVKALEDLGSKMPTETVLEHELNSLAIGMELATDRLRGGDFRYHDEISLGERAAGDLQKGIKGLSNFVNSAFKVNPLHGWTNIRQQMNAYASMSRWNLVKESGFSDLHPAYKELMNEVGVTPKEWDFIRRAESTIDLKGRQILTPDDINAIPAEDFKTLFPKGKRGISAAKLEAKKFDLVGKYAALIGVENRATTPVPSLTTRLRINRGEPRGTVFGEAYRFLGVFKSFPIEAWTNILAPMYRRGEFKTTAQVVGGLGATYTLSQVLKQLANGKITSEDYFKDPGTIGSILTNSVFPLPFVDSLIYSFFSRLKEHPRKATGVDLTGGPLISGAAKNLSGIADLVEKGVKGDLEFKDIEIATSKFLYKNTPFIKMPGIGVFTESLYNEHMNNLSPGWKSNSRRYNKDRGLKEIGR